MIEYRLAPDDDELDDYDEGAELSLDDDMGEYGVDDEDDEDIGVPPLTPVPGALPSMVVETTEIEVVDVVPPGAPARKPVVKAAAPAKKAAPQKAAKKAAPKKVAKKAAPKKKAAKKTA